MGNLFQLIIDSLSTTPGVLIYNLVLSFAFAAALQGSLVHWRGPTRTQANRQASGLFALLLFQLVLFTVSGLDWQGMLNLNQVLPPIDRAMLAFSLVWIIWLWAFPEPVRWLDVLTFMLAVLVIIAGLFSISLWSTPNLAITFNGSWLDQAWSVFSLVLTLIGIAVLLINHPNRWGNGIFILAFLCASLITHLLVPAAGNYAPVIRLAQIITYPILIALPQRLTDIGGIPTLDKPASALDERRYSTDPKSVRALLDLALDAEPEKLRRDVIHAISQTMLADLSLLVSAPNVEGLLNIEGGYDLIREDYLPARELPKSALPLISNALLKGRGVRLPSNHSSSPDMRTLAEILGLPNPGNLLAVPLAEPNQEPVGGILLLSPYSNRVWSAEDQTYLTGVVGMMVTILHKAAQVSSDRARGEQAASDLLAAREQLNALTQQIASHPTRDIEALFALQAETQAELDHLQAENEQLRISSLAITPVQTSTDVAQIENELRLSLSQMAHLQNALADANIRIMELEKQAKNAPPPPPPQPDESIRALAQELRQAVVSLSNQITLLSVGDQPILPRQVERLKAVVERLRATVGVLVKTVSIPNLPYALSIEDINPSAIVEQAISAINTTLREKNVTMRAELPERYPLVRVDRRAFKQVMEYLLQNALTVTPNSGAITLKVRTQDDQPEQRFLLLQVMDSGGGISNKDLENLFSGIGPSADQPINGLSSPHEFSITRALVEALGGRLWVDTVAGQSSTFSVVLPLAQPKPIEVKQAT
jgi:signal transduction histidine kinase